MQKVVKAEKILDKLVAQNTLTSEGKDWLVSALDPFHDIDHPLAGYPDSDNSKTIVSTYQYAMDVSKNAGLAPGNWDAHVFTLPYVATSGASVVIPVGVPASGLYAVRNGASVGRGLVNVIQANPGDSLFPVVPADYATTFASSLPVSSTVFNGSCARVLAMGIEIVDTTADIYKQGALTAYRMPQMSSTGQIVFSDPAAAPEPIVTSVIYKSYCAPPTSVSKALSLVGSRQWSMADGAYAVLTQSSIANPITSSSNMCTFLAPNGHRDTQGELSLITPFNDTVVVPGSMSSSPSPCMMLPYNTTGFMLTGLNEKSTFRIKFKMIVETAPQPWQPDLVVLASPSAPYDPSTLEAYSKALSSVPVAVMLNDNAFGDWFVGLARIISKLALPVSAALAPFFPSAPIVGTAVAGISKAVTRVVDGSKKDDKLIAKPSSRAISVRNNMVKAQKVRK